MCNIASLNTPYSNLTDSAVKWWQRRGEVLVYLKHNIIQNLDIGFSDLRICGVDIALRLY